MALTQVEKAKQFEMLHKSDRILVLPNVWDVAGASVFQEAGFPAIATTSRGIAGALGYSDGEAMDRSEMVDVVARIAMFLDVPLSADMERGYGETAQEVAATARAVISAGAVGLNIEDGTNLTSTRSGDPLTPLSEQCEKIRAVREVAEYAEMPFTINARTDVFWLEVGDEHDRLARTVDRSLAFRDAGADCVFVPGLRTPELISTLVKEVDIPVNILAMPSAPSIPQLEEMGVARVSVGSGPMRAVLGLLKRIAHELLREGTYRSFVEEAVEYGELIEALTTEGESHVDYPTT